MTNEYDVKTVFHNAPIGFALLDCDKRCAYVNASFARHISKMPLKDHHNTHIKEILGDSKWKDMKLLIGRALKGETISQGLIMTVGDGIPHMFYLVSFYPVKNATSNSCIGILFEDITYQKYLESEWRRAKEELEIILNHSASGIIVYDHEQCIILINNTIREMFGWNVKSSKKQQYVRDDFITAIEDQYILSDDQNRKFDPHKLPAIRVYKGEKEPEKVFKATHKETQKETWYHMKARPILDTQKELDMVLVIVHDITIQKEIEQRKDDFIGFASHELKTPITTQSALLQLIQSRLKKQQYDKLDEYADKMGKQIKRQIDLIDNLLDVSRIRTGKIVYKFMDISIDKLVREVADEFQLNHPELEIQVEGKTKAIVKADRYRISQVLFNLLNNAVKYAPNSNKLVIKIQNQAMMVTIGIQDFGPGIPKERIENIFDRFYRIEDKDSSISGLGIGLYISYAIIKRHHGRVWVESKVGEGSTFYFSIPKVKSPS